MSKPNIVGKLGKGNPRKIWEIVIKGYSNNQITSTYTQGIRPTATGTDDNEKNRTGTDRRGQTQNIIGTRRECR